MTDDAPWPTLPTGDPDALDSPTRTGPAPALTVLYYLHETNPDNGLVRDKTDRRLRSTSPPAAWRSRRFRSSSSAASSSETSPPRSPRKLRYLLECPQGPGRTSGYKGFFYHFLDIETGRRVWQCELSTIDSAFLFAGALTCGTYFDRDTPERSRSEPGRYALQRADWNWARSGGPTLTHGWRPENGFIRTAGRLRRGPAALYPRARLADASAAAGELPRLLRDIPVEEVHGRELLYSGPLFTHRFSHMWIDFRGIRDEFMRERAR